MRLGRPEDAAEAFRSCVTLAPRSCLAQDCTQLLGQDTASEPALTAGSGGSAVVGG